MSREQGNSNGPRPLTDFEIGKWALNDYFAYYRSGNDEGRSLNDGHAPWQVARYFPDYHLAPDPRQKTARPQNWNDIYKQQTPSSLPIYTDTKHYAPAPRPAASLSLNQLLYPLGGETERLTQIRARFINSFGIPINFKRVLGKGGMGLAVLCTSSSPARGAPREFCLKADLSNSKSMKMDGFPIKVRSLFLHQLR